MSCTMETERKLFYGKCTISELRTFITARTGDHRPVTECYEELCQTLFELDANAIFDFPALPRDIRLCVYDRLRLPETEAPLNPAIFLTSKWIKEDAKELLEEVQHIHIAGEACAIRFNKSPTIVVDILAPFKKQLQCWPRSLRIYKDFMIHIELTGKTCESVTTSNGAQTSGHCDVFINNQLYLLASLLAGTRLRSVVLHWTAPQLQCKRVQNLPLQLLHLDPREYQHEQDNWLYYPELAKWTGLMANMLAPMALLPTTFVGITQDVLAKLQSLREIASCADRCGSTSLSDLWKLKRWTADLTSKAEKVGLKGTGLKSLGIQLKYLEGGSPFHGGRSVSLNVGSQEQHFDALEKLKREFSGGKWKNVRDQVEAIEIQRDLKANEQPDDLSSKLQQLDISK